MVTPGFHLARCYGDGKLECVCGLEDVEQEAIDLRPEPYLSDPDGDVGPSDYYDADREQEQQ